MQEAKQYLIVALDDMSKSEVVASVRALRHHAATFKVGLSLFAALGPKIVETIRDLGVDVFLDLKLHDIPMQVEKTILAVKDLGPKFITVHALGGKNMMELAVNAASCAGIRILAVSILTSLDDQSLSSLGFRESVPQCVPRLIGLAYSGGVRGFVCSAQEVASIKKTYGDHVYLVTPGIRPRGSESHDQARVMSGKDAILAGADALVVGRPITAASDPVGAILLLRQEIEEALSEKKSKAWITE